MRNVTRVQKPDSLRKYAARWTKELLKAIDESKASGESVPDKYYDRYQKDDIREALRSMYGNGTFCFCCYCESIIDDVSFDHIEHRMPKKQSKDKYPEQTYNWDNLHLSCEKCNNHKRNRYNESAPILDAVVDKISEHLGYELSDTEGVYRETRSDQGITTVEDANLDRASLRKARLIIWNKTIKAINEIKKLGDDARTYTKKKILVDKCSEEHGSLIKYLLDEWEV